MLRSAVVVSSWLLVLVAAVYAMTHMNPGVDTWISIAGGQHILAHGVGDRDPFSFNSRPPAEGPMAAVLPAGWINQNWLTHVVLAAMANTWGLDALVAWKLIVYLGVGALLVVCGRLRAAPWPAASVAATAALAAGRDFFEIRAQDLTNLLLALLLCLLVIGTRGRAWVLWLTVPLCALWANLHGGFIVGLLVLGLYVGTEALTGRFLPHLSSITPDRVSTVAVTLAIGLLATVMASPFRLANITHTFEVTVSEDASGWQEIAEWRPLMAEGPGDPTVFLFLVGATAAAMAAALGGRARRPVSPRSASGDTAPLPDRDVWSIALLVVLTAMAFQSRRFLPLAAIAAAPVLAESLGYCGSLPMIRRMLPKPRWVAVGASVVLTTVAVSTGSWLGLRAAQTYVGPWPASAAGASVFDRMTHSYRRADGLCRFLELNAVSGRLWTPWDEAGFIMACQKTDDAAGDLPVKVFIDGRAQAAYDLRVSEAYSQLRHGGPECREILESGRSLTPEVDAACREWVLETLDAWGVTMVHENPEGMGLPLFRAVSTSKDWSLVYADAVHTLFTRSDSLPGGSLDNHGGGLHFPDQLSRRITLAERLVAQRRDLGTASAEAREALSQSPGARTMALMINTGILSGDLAGARARCETYLNDLVEHWSAYEGRDGFGARLVAAETALGFLQRAAAASEDTASVSTLRRLDRRIRQARDEIDRQILW
jgi:hypothetical protein